MSKHQKRADIVAALELLCERFPKCFVLREHRRVPLKIGIRDDIIAIIGDAIDHQLLGITLQYTPTTRSIGWRRSAGRRGSISTAIRPGHRLRGRCVACCRAGSRAQSAQAHAAGTRRNASTSASSEA